MRRTVRQLLRIAQTTALEGLQQPVGLLLTVACVTLTALGPLVQLHVFGEAGRLARDSGLACMLVFGLFLVGVTSGFTMADELRRGTAATTLAKPVGRAVFLIGKWLGVVGVLALFVASATWATLLAERTAERFVETPTVFGAFVDRYSGLGGLAAVGGALAFGAVLNFARSTRFGLAALLGLLGAQTVVALGCGFIDRTGAWLPAFDLQLNARVLPAVILIFLLLTLFAALATALSTRLRTGPTLAVCTLALVLGFLADSLFAQARSPLLRLAYAVVPDVQHFWLADALANQGRIPWRYVMRCAAYTAAGAVLLLGAGHAAFRHRDLD